MKDIEQPTSEVERTTAFFDRPADSVVGELAERIYEPGTLREYFDLGEARTLQITTSEGIRDFRITLAEPYSEASANQFWRGERLQTLRAAHPGDVLTYAHRSGILSFIKTRGGDNILLRELEEVGTGQRLTNPTAISRLLGLQPEERGQLALNGERLRFHRPNS